MVAGLAHVGGVEPDKNTDVGELHQNKLLKSLSPPDRRFLLVIESMEN